jgi:hypothetical protein
LRDGIVVARSESDEAMQILGRNHWIASLRSQSRCGWSVVLPALFAAVAPAGAAHIPFTIGAIIFAITIVAAVAAASARETYRLQVAGLGNPQGGADGEAG